METIGSVVWLCALCASIHDLDDDSLCILFNDHIISLEYHTTHTCTLPYHHRFVNYLYLRFMLHLVLFFVNFMLDFSGLSSSAGLKRDSSNKLDNGVRKICPQPRINDGTMIQVAVKSR